MIGAALVSAIATLGQGFVRARLSQGMAFDMRNDLFKHIESLPFATLDQLRTGGLDDPNFQRRGHHSDVFQQRLGAAAAGAADDRRQHGCWC